LAKMVKKGSEAQKERLRQVREAIERSQGGRQQARQPTPPQRAPVQLAPGVARRVPPPVRPKQRRAPARVPVPTGKRAATNYNAMAKAKPRAVQASPILTVPSQAHTNIASHSTPPD